MAEYVIPYPLVYNPEFSGTTAYNEKFLISCYSRVNKAGVGSLIAVPYQLVHPVTVFIDFKDDSVFVLNSRIDDDGNMSIENTPQSQMAPISRQ